MNLTKERREELKALADEATKGPWIKRGCKNHPGETAFGLLCNELRDAHGEHVVDEPANERFIAASREALPAALADIDELVADRLSTRKALNETMEWLVRCAASVGWRFGEPLGDAYKNGDMLQAKLADAMKALEHVELYSNDPQVVRTARAVLAKLKP